MKQNFIFNESSIDHPIGKVLVVSVKTTGIIVHGATFQSWISRSQDVHDVLLNGMSEPNINSEVFEIVIASDVIQDHQFVVPDEELI